MDLNQIALFARVVDAGSFTQAAKSLNLPTSSVSRGLMKLERELGARLLQRTTRKLHLTEAGRRFYEEVSGAVGALEQAASYVTELNREAEGTVRLTLPPDFGDGFMASTIAKFRLNHPRVMVEVDITSRRVDLIAEGFDLALRAGKLLDSSMVGKKVMDTEFWICAAPSYLERRGVPKTLGALFEHDCLCHTSVGTSWTLNGPRGLESIAVRPAVTSGDLSFIARFAAAGGGLALIPNVLAGSPTGASEVNLVRVLGSYSSVGGSLWLLWPSAGFVPRRVELLREHLFSALHTRLKACFGHGPQKASQTSVDEATPAPRTAKLRRGTSTR